MEINKIGLGNNLNVCPICNALSPEYRVGLDALFKISTRKEYDAIKLKVNQQAGKETLNVHELCCKINEDKSIKVSFYARCSNCNSKWESEMIITPTIGDK